MPFEKLKVNAEPQAKKKGTDRKYPDFARCFRFCFDFLSLKAFLFRIPPNDILSPEPVTAKSSAIFQKNISKS